MPITGINGIPEVLVNMLAAVLETHQLQTWNIFEEKSGNISFKLRFQSEGEGHGIQRNSTISYRRKSEGQINRDRRRSVKRRRTASCQTEESSPTMESNRAVSEVDSSVYSSSPIQITNLDCATAESSPATVRHELCPPKLETISESESGCVEIEETETVRQTEKSDEEVDVTCSSEDSDGSYETGSEESEDQESWMRQIDLNRIENGLTPIYGTVPNPGINLDKFFGPNWRDKF